MTLKVYLDGVLQATETLDASTLSSGQRRHVWNYTFGSVDIESNTIKPYSADDDNSYNVTFIPCVWNAVVGGKTRGRYPNHYDSDNYDFVYERRRTSGSAVETGNMGTMTERDYHSSSDPGAYFTMLKAEIYVYFVSAAKTHLIFRDPTNVGGVSDRIVRSVGTGTIVRDA